MKQFNLLNLGNGIVVLVFTGADGGGKTTAMIVLHEKLSNRGYKVLIKPESATKLITAGMTPGELANRFFQTAILNDTLNEENVIFSIARHYRDLGRKVVILCDRGTMDGQAYMNAGEFNTMIHELGYTQRQLRDERYHAVMHLVTAAKGAEAFYTTLSNNPARVRRTIEEARDLDDRTLQAWMAHEHPRVFDNSTDFKGKMARLYAEVCAIIGDPIPIETEDKFLVRFAPDFDSVGVRHVRSHIIQDYLVRPEPTLERRLRARGSGGEYSYYHTTKKKVASGARVEDQKMIAHRDYSSMLGLRDPSKITLHKNRLCFFWHSQFFELDVFLEERSGLILMEAERSVDNPGLDLPPFVDVVANVTNNEEFSNSRIADKDWVMPAM